MAISFLFGRAFCPCGLYREPTRFYRKKCYYARLLLLHPVFWLFTWCVWPRYVTRFVGWLAGGHYSIRRWPRWKDKQLPSSLLCRPQERARIRRKKTRVHIKRIIIIIDNLPYIWFLLNYVRFFFYFCFFYYLFLFSTLNTAWNSRVTFAKILSNRIYT